MALVTDPGKARAFLDRLTESAIIWGVAQARRGVDAVLVSSAFAGGGFISRAAYAEFVLPYENRLNQAISPGCAGLHPHVRAHWGSARPDARNWYGRARHPRPSPVGQRRSGGGQTPGRTAGLHQRQHELGRLVRVSHTREVEAEARRCLREGARRRLHPQHGVFGCSAGRALETRTLAALVAPRAVLIAMASSPWHSLPARPAYTQGSSRAVRGCSRLQAR